MPSKLLPMVSLDYKSLLLYFDKKACFAKNAIFLLVNKLNLFNLNFLKSLQKIHFILFIVKHKQALNQL